MNWSIWLKNRVLQNQNKKEFSNESKLESNKIKTQLNKLFIEGYFIFCGELV